VYNAKKYAINSSYQQQEETFTKSKLQNFDLKFIASKNIFLETLNWMDIIKRKYQIK
jgi:hypothetical protein